MPALAANVRKAAAESTLQFDWLLGDRQFFTFKSIAALTGMSDSFIEKLWDDAQHALHLGGHGYNAGNGLKSSKRVPRVFVVRLLVKSATYNADQKLDAVASCFREFTRHELETLQWLLASELKKKS